MRKKKKRRKKEGGKGENEKILIYTVENIPVEKEICPYEFKTLHSTGL
jgi:hypothetical protein